MLNNSNLKKKIVAIFAIVALTYSNFALVGSKMYKGLISYAIDDIEQTASEENNEFQCEVEVNSKDIHKETMVDKESTEFNEGISLKLKNVKDVFIEDMVSTFYNSEQEESEIAKLAYVKTKLNKEDLKSILGSEGFLEILDEGNNTLAKVSLTEIEELEHLIEEAKDEENESPINLPQTFTKTIEEENDDGELEEKEIEETRSYISVTDDTVVITYELEKSILKFSFKNINTVIDEDNDEVNNVEQNAEVDNVNEKENKEINFVIENTKSIFDVQDLENLNYLKEEIYYTFNKMAEKDENEIENLATATEDVNIEDEEIDEEELEITLIENTIKFKDTTTRAKLELDNENLEIGKTNKVDYKVVLDTTTPKFELFKNPLLVLELPERIASVNTKNSQFTVENDGGAFVERHVTKATLAGKQYIVIQLAGEQTEESIKNGDTIINLALEVNVGEGEEETQSTKLYYRNDTVTAYESGAGFDTAEVDISLVVGSDENEEINEGQQETDNNEENKLENGNNSNYIDFYATNNSGEKLIRIGEEFEYLVYIYNNGLIDNAKLEDMIPDGLEFVDSRLYGYNTEENDFNLEKDIEDVIQYDETSNLLSVDVNKLEKETTLLKIKVKANAIEEGIYIKKIINEIELLQNEEVLEKETEEITVSDAFLDINIDEISDKTDVGDVINYRVTLKNFGLFTSEEKMIKIKIPEELEIGTLSVQKNHDEPEIAISLNDNEEEIPITVGPEETIIVTFTAAYRAELENSKEVVTIASVDDKSFEWDTKLLSYYEIEEDEDESENGEEGSENTEQNPGNGEGNTENTEHNPGNGEGNTGNEEQNPGNGDDGSEVFEQGSENEEQGSENGEQGPENGEQGSENEEQGSESEKQNQGSEKEENLEKPEFDLSLTQSIKKITVANREGITTYTYDDANFAKVEIGRKYMNGSLVTMEYEITVKNEGTIPGYARKIVDYLPEGVTFNSELNEDWYIGEDGNIYSVALIDKVLNPEDTATLKLILTRTMTDDSTGTVANIAEIYEATNEAELDDINSTPGDKKEKQNDISKVEVLISVKTGTVVMYITLVIAVLAILGYGTIKVKNITFKREVK